MGPFRSHKRSAAAAAKGAVVRVSALLARVLRQRDPWQPLALGVALFVLSSAWHLVPAGGEVCAREGLGVLQRRGGKLAHSCFKQV